MWRRGCERVPGTWLTAVTAQAVGSSALVPTTRHAVPWHWSSRAGTCWKLSLSPNEKTTIAAAQPWVVA